MSDPDRSDWYKDAIIYELRVRSFYDADGDGVGDLRGLAEKLDYLHDLGVNTLWLLPFYPSPMRDDGYDIADYTNVHSSVGTLRDFKALLKQAHDRGLRVITELVLNHTSDQHGWFQRARRAPAGSSLRNFYVWSDDPRRYPEARIIFQDFETSNWAWDSLAQAYYWHRFFSHQPDLNFDNPEVHRAIFEVVDFWFELGVDGVRLDAVPYLFEREGTNCENLPETHGFLQKLRAHIDQKFKNRMLLAEANQWPEDAAAYFGQGDECQMAFHFPIMPRLFMAIHLEDRYPIVDILEQTPVIPESAQWALFLRNHDELTLEMVTDEERDYMLSVYAREIRARVNLGIRRRLAPLLDNNRRRIELMNALLFSLPGTPIVYYGDEIGMGDNVYLGDRDGVRTPMQWSPDRNAGFSRANPQQLILPTIVDPEYHYEAINVETQQRNPSSLLWWTKRLIALRKQYLAFGRGSVEMLSPSNRKVFAFLRRYENQVLLVVANLSRFAQYVELDLSELQGRRPVELFGFTRFPPIREQPYLLMLGPHNFFWFALEELEITSAHRASGEYDPVPVLEVTSSWQELLAPAPRSPLERALLRWLPAQRWFRGKARVARSARIVDSLPLTDAAADVRVVLVDVTYTAGEPETYALLLRFQPASEPPHDAIVYVRHRADGQENGALVEAAHDGAVASCLVDVVARGHQLEGAIVSLSGVPAGGEIGDAEQPPGRLLGNEQSNTSWVVGERLVAKLLRRVETGTGIELEMLEHLQRVGFQHAPVAFGHIGFTREPGGIGTLLVVESFVPNHGDAWSFTRGEISRFYESVLARGDPLPPREPPMSLVESASREPHPLLRDCIGSYLELVRRLGQRTAELHGALATVADDPAFAPEPFTTLIQRSSYQALRNLQTRVFEMLHERAALLPESSADLAQQLSKRERELRGRMRRVIERRLGGQRTRVHGDYHLGQVLYTGRDFVIIDFEGEPARGPSERRRKRSPLVDVAGMLRSFHYAAHSALDAHALGGSMRAEDAALLEPWARAWYRCVASVFIASYLDELTPHTLLPEAPEDVRLVLDMYLLDKCLYEVAYELNNRPNWVGIPLHGLIDWLDMP